MHFSKTYEQLLLNLPQELRDNAIQYRQLKKLINQVVNELASLGLSPAILQELLGRPQNLSTSVYLATGEGKSKDIHCDSPKVVYEFNNDSNNIEPRLRLWLNDADPAFPYFSKINLKHESLSSPVWKSQQQAVNVLDSPPEISLSGGESNLTVETRAHEIVVPLVFDTAFYQLLSTALQSLSAHLETVHADFVTTLESLSREITASARPVSSTSNFQPHSILSSDPRSVRVSSSMLRTSKRSDLYCWREIFQLYIEAEVFESVNEANRGERSVEESEWRLQAFTDRLAQSGLGDGRKHRLKYSQRSLDTFLGLNLFILNVKKFQLANAEATRKILKKHTKRTALPPPPSSASDSSLTTSSQILSSFTAIPKTSLPRILVQAIGETLLPVIPHLDDYACLICTSIAFKPIRLFCGHLFCVRCLVKMQKRGKGNCPMCRAPTVLTADRSNVDWALLNFMQDWFPIEAKQKLKQNEREAAEEELVELGINPHPRCTIM